MPDNPTLPGGPFALPDHRVLELSGRDAGAFAHAQFMNDVAGLDVGRWQWNGWLTPKGRVVALFALLKLDPERLWLLLPDVDPEALATQLQRFVFRSKVAIVARPDCRVAGGFVAPAHARDADFHAPDATRVELDCSGAGGPRTLWIDTSGEAGPALDDAPGTLRWRVFDTRHGLPRLPPSQAGQWTPQMLSLDRLRAFSVKKGCYPGQEIVARTHFLGQAKRGLVLLQADEPVAPGSEVHVDGQAIGTICSAAEGLLLAVLPQAREPGPLYSADGAILHEQPLLDGLAR